MTDGTSTQSEHHRRTRQPGVASRLLDLRFAIWDIVRGETGGRGEGIWLVTYDGDWRETFRPDIPSVARIYDYLLGGKDNYPVDRAVGESMIAQLPNVRLDSILADPALRELIDFNEPVALLFLSILHFVADEADPAGIIVEPGRTS
jgi:S-adenosyl methyltransferase